MSGRGYVRRDVSRNPITGLLSHVAPMESESQASQRQVLEAQHRRQGTLEPLTQRTNSVRFVQDSIDAATQNIPQSRQHGVHLSPLVVARNNTDASDGSGREYFTPEPEPTPARLMRSTERRESLVSDVPEATPDTIFDLQKKLVDHESGIVLHQGKLHAEYLTACREQISQEFLMQGYISVPAARKLNVSLVNDQFIQSQPYWGKFKSSFLLRDFYLYLLDRFQAEFQTTRIMSTGRVSGKSSVMKYALSVVIGLISIAIPPLAAGGLIAVGTAAAVQSTAAAAGLSAEEYARVLTNIGSKKEEELSTYVGKNIGSIGELAHCLAYNLTLRYRQQVRKLDNGDQGVRLLAKKLIKRILCFMDSGGLVNPELFPIELQLIEATSIVEPKLGRSIRPRPNKVHPRKLDRQDSKDYDWTDDTVCRQSGVELIVDGNPTQRLYYCDITDPAVGDGSKVGYSVEPELTRATDCQKFYFRRAVPGEVERLGLRAVRKYDFITRSNLHATMFFNPDRAPAPPQQPRHGPQRPAGRAAGRG